MINKSDVKRICSKVSRENSGYKIMFEVYNDIIDCPDNTIGFTIMCSAEDVPTMIKTVSVPIKEFEETKTKKLLDSICKELNQKRGIK